MTISLSLSLQTDPMPSNKMTALTVHLPFVGFTYTHSSKISDNPPCLVGGNADMAVSPEAVDSDLKDENKRLLTEIDGLKKQVSSSTGPGKGSDGKFRSVWLRLEFSVFIIMSTTLK